MHDPHACMQKPEATHAHSPCTCHDLHMLSQMLENAMLLAGSIPKLSTIRKQHPFRPPTCSVKSRCVSCCSRPGSFTSGSPWIVDCLVRRSRMADSTTCSSRRGTAHVQLNDVQRKYSNVQIAQRKYCMRTDHTAPTFRTWQHTRYSQPTSRNGQGDRICNRTRNRHRNGPFPP